jgi:hypothetical protein
VATPATSVTTPSSNVMLSADNRDRDSPIQRILGNPRSHSRHLSCSQPVRTSSLSHWELLAASAAMLDGAIKRAPLIAGGTWSGSSRGRDRFLFKAGAAGFAARWMRSRRAAPWPRGTRTEDNGSTLGSLATTRGVNAIAVAQGQHRNVVKDLVLVEGALEAVVVVASKPTDSDVRRYQGRQARGEPGRPNPGRGRVCAPGLWPTSTPD